VRRVPPSSGNPIAMLVLRVTAVGRQEQRRGHFRLNLIIQPLDCSVWEHDASAAEGDGLWKPVNATINDISAGGVGLSSLQEIPNDTKVHLRFPYPMGEGDFVGDVRVKSVIPQTDAGLVHYKIGTVFEEGIERAKLERLARCIHRVQLEQKRREQSRAGR
jgi:c-di-GMP-binding flagellar brake protein YcgR